MTWSRITISARAAMPFSRPTSFERLARNFESFRKPRTGLPILFLCASLNRNEGRHEGGQGNDATDGEGGRGGAGAIDGVLWGSRRAVLYRARFARLWRRHPRRSCTTACCWHSRVRGTRWRGGDAPAVAEVRPTFIRSGSPKVSRTRFEHAGALDQVNSADFPVRHHHQITERHGRDDGPPAVRHDPRCVTPPQLTRLLRRDLPRVRCRSGRRGAAQRHQRSRGTSCRRSPTTRLCCSTLRLVG